GYTFGQIPINKVYITEYPDPTPDSAGQFVQFPDEMSRITAAEARWGSETVVKALNNQVKLAASRFGWDFVDGIAAQFLQHGLPADHHWIVRLHEALANQLNASGTMHPNAVADAQHQVWDGGYNVYKKQLVQHFQVDRIAGQVF